jgi:hypothetical protein
MIGPWQREVRIYVALEGLPHNMSLATAYTGISLALAFLGASEN